jgi:uncharacterized protein YkwD
MPCLRPRIVAAAPSARRGSGRARGAHSLRAVLAAVLTIATCSSLAAAPAARATRPARANGTDVERALLVKLNVLRRQHGLAPLRCSPNLVAAARQHSLEMASRGYFGHASADGTSLRRRLARFYPSARWHYWAVGENLLWSSPDVDAAGALELWLGSPEHRRNLLSPRWREVGLAVVHVASGAGVYQGRPVTVATADFGVRRP